MEIGLIHPPGGAEHLYRQFHRSRRAVTKVMWGTIPYVICMMLAIVILSIFPG
jgi:TRAP-type C4-dicarboxylate transport system permease large subunit